MPENNSSTPNSAEKLSAPQPLDHIDASTFPSMPYGIIGFSSFTKLLSLGVWHRSEPPLTSEDNHVPRGVKPLESSCACSSSECSTLTNHTNDLIRRIHRLEAHNAVLRSACTNLSHDRNQLKAYYDIQIKATKRTQDGLSKDAIEREIMANEFKNRKSEFRKKEKEYISEIGKKDTEIAFLNNVVTELRETIENLSERYAQLELNLERLEEQPQDKNMESVVNIWFRNEGYGEEDDTDDESDEDTEDDSEDEVIQFNNQQSGDESAKEDQLENDLVCFAKEEEDDDDGDSSIVIEFGNASGEANTKDKVKTSTPYPCSLGFSVDKILGLASKPQKPSEPYIYYDSDITDDSESDIDELLPMIETSLEKKEPEKLVSIDMRITEEEYGAIVAENATTDPFVSFLDFLTESDIKSVELFPTGDDKDDELESEQANECQAVFGQERAILAAEESSKDIVTESDIWKNQIKKLLSVPANIRIGSFVDTASSQMYQFAISNLDEGSFLVGLNDLCRRFFVSQSAVLCAIAEGFYKAIARDLKRNPAILATIRDFLEDPVLNKHDADFYTILYAPLTLTYPFLIILCDTLCTHESQITFLNHLQSLACLDSERQSHHAYLLVILYQLGFIDGSCIVEWSRLQNSQSHPVYQHKFFSSNSIKMSPDFQYELRRKAMRLVHHIEKNSSSAAPTSQLHGVHAHEPKNQPCQHVKDRLNHKYHTMELTPRVIYSSGLEEMSNSSTCSSSEETHVNSINDCLFKGNASKAYGSNTGNMVHTVFFPFGADDLYSPQSSALHGYKPADLCNISGPPGLVSSDSDLSTTVSTSHTPIEQSNMSSFDTCYVLKNPLQVSKYFIQPYPPRVNRHVSFVEHD
ncbi:hypothetical protein H4219_000502 [Mycoemilia scoparia]|uniref:Uncharacterized protein n=1 Tax=Mycoemilia scoparia TaxID=417184 RepID=A0A9W8A972_9FUNG|nr:hypothetical protein H4219_000502 [Mycoemilia scoparia]